MSNIIKRFLRDKTGATAIEYALIVAVLSLAIVGGVSTLTNSLTDLWGNKLAGALKE
ncbi:MAG: Flp family type IVb pilin [Rhizobiaceae bacterium]